jgi:hypothetical protein
MSWIWKTVSGIALGYGGAGAFTTATLYKKDCLEGGMDESTRCNLCTFENYAWKGVKWPVHFADVTKYWFGKCD